MKYALLAGLAVSFVAVSSFLPSAEAEAKVCKATTVTATGSSAGAVAKFRKRRALRRAKASWGVFVSQRFGTDFRKFSKGKSQRTSCKLNARGNTECNIRAIPCN